MIPLKLPIIAEDVGDIPCQSCDLILRSGNEKPCVNCASGASKKMFGNWRLITVETLNSLSHARGTGAFSSLLISKDDVFRMQVIVARYREQHGA